MREERKWCRRITDNKDTPVSIFTGIKKKLKYLSYANSDLMETRIGDIMF